MFTQLAHLFSSKYLFSRSLGPYQSNLAYLFVGFCVLIIILSLVFGKITKSRDLFAKKASRKFSSFAWTMGLVGIILYIFRQINVLYLSAPVIVLVWGIVAVIWLFFIFKYVFVVAPKRRSDLMSEQKKREYIP